MVQSGVLYTSGLIAGEGIVGILLAVFAIIPMGVNAAGEALNLGNKLALTNPDNFYGFTLSLGNIGGLVFFAGLLFTIFFFANKAGKSKKSK